MNYRPRLNKAKSILSQLKLDALFISHPENRRYLSGFTGSVGILVITQGRPSLIIDLRYSQQVHYETEGFNIIEVKVGEKLNQALIRLIKRKKWKVLGLEDKNLSLAAFKELKGKLTQVVFKPLGSCISDLRAIKDKQELSYIQRAAKIADEALIYIFNILKPGMTEREVSARLDYIIRRQGGEKSPFDTIVASGVRSSLPHGVASDKVIQDGDMVILDLGVVYKGYCADLTRTVVMGKPTSRENRIFEAVRRAQEKAIQKIKDGVKCVEVDEAAREVLGRYGFKKYFGHGTGHGIGLSVHESPRITVNSKNVLKGGMVVTIEPGVYIPRWGGLRIEDMILVTKKGAKVLTSAPKRIKP